MCRITNLKYVCEHVQLGLTITSKLYWEPHIDTLIATADKVVGLIKFLSHISSCKVLELASNTFILGKINYASVIYSGTIETNSQLLNILQYHAGLAVLDTMKGKS
ncbi:unnamed protein product [Didymodactylos carnosus]|uniref:Uncharacterized protein n=1 Tax=Didymodactylos carnosus TaxID=1234261 RepID=A0A8S2GX53_9BILA|nr:unnamed protein product [Didymodactylos carnosus]CAF3572517.1 unnamed protein product [Didymodactylos carnosus]